MRACECGQHEPYAMHSRTTLPHCDPAIAILRTHRSCVNTDRDVGSEPVNILPYSDNDLFQTQSHVSIDPLSDFTATLLSTGTAFTISWLRASTVFESRTLTLVQ
jgi:hypothetical protein